MFIYIDEVDEHPFARCFGIDEGILIIPGLYSITVVEKMNIHLQAGLVFFVGTRF